MITSSPITIIQILSDVYSGKVRIPDFQRSPIWEANDVEILLDSIYQGYPLGSFLFWETSEQLKERNPLGLTERPPRPERQYLIDGQQRTIAMYGVFTNTLTTGEEPKQIDYKAYFDLDDESFQLYKKTDLARNPKIVKESQIPLNEALVFDLIGRSVRSSEAIQNRLMNEKNANRMNNFQKLVRNLTTYIVAGVVVSGVQLSEATEIFVRMNKTGRPLSIEDLMVARTYSSEPPFNLREELNDFNSNNAPRGFELKERTILQCCSACLVEGTSEKEILASADGNSLRDNWENCTRALSLTMDFIQGNMVKVSQFLPNDIILAPLTYFFYNQQHATAHHHSELSNYFWGVSISQRYIQGQNPKAREDIRLMDYIMKGQHVQEVDYSVTVNDVINQKISLTSAFCKSILCLLSTYSPRDWLTNQPINLIACFALANTRQFHHIFPQRYLATLSKNPEFEKRIQPYIDSIANIAILTKLSNEIVGSRPPSQYLRRIESEYNSNIQKTLETHMISEEAYSRLLEDDFSGFLTLRAEDISKELNNKLHFGVV